MILPLDLTLGLVLIRNPTYIESSVHFFVNMVKSITVDPLLYLAEKKAEMMAGSYLQTHGITPEEKQRGKDMMYNGAKSYYVAVGMYNVTVTPYHRFILSKVKRILPMSWINKADKAIDRNRVHPRDRIQP